MSDVSFVVAPPGGKKVIFSSMLNIPGEGKSFILAYDDKIIVPEQCEYAFVFQLMGVNNESVQYCISSAIKKVYNFIDNK